jgi:tetratricopeptide (TPR) repeat protein
MVKVSCYGPARRAVAIAVILAATAPPAAATETASKTVERECFAEGTGTRHCAELVYNCSATDAGCLMDDLSGAILRAGGNTSAKYAAYLARGVVARRAKHASDAIADFEAAQSLQPKLATPLILMGQVYGELGHHARALVSFEEANRRAPGLPVILLHRALTRKDLGDAAGAIIDLSEAITIIRAGRPLPEGADEPLEVLLTARGEAHTARGDVATARADFTAAVAIKPSHAPAREALARLAQD